MARKKHEPNLDKKLCTHCNSSKVKTTNFYSSNSIMFPDGRCHICKKCVLDNVDVTNIDSVKKMLMQLDKPFIAVEWQKCLSSGKEPFGWYLRIISSLHQYKDLTFEKSVEGKINSLDYKLTNNIDLNEVDIYGEASQDVKRKWGLIYSEREYYGLEKTWNEMNAANNIITPQHRSELEMYCKLKILVDRALENNNMKDFEMLNRQFTALKKDSGFRPIDKLASNESAGIRNFGTIFEEVERDGYIPPYNIVENQDIVDKTIMYILNYTRKLLSVEQMIEPPDDTPEVDGD